MQPRDPKFQLLANTIGFDPRRVDELERYRRKNENRTNSALASVKNTQQVGYSYTNPETNQVEIRYQEVLMPQKAIRERKPIFPVHKPKEQKGYEFVDLSQQWRAHYEESSKMEINNIQEERNPSINMPWHSTNEDIDLEKALEEKGCCGGLFSFWR